MNPPFLSHDNLQNPFLSMLQCSPFAKQNVVRVFFYFWCHLPEGSDGEDFCRGGEGRVCVTSDGSYFCLCQGLGVFFGSGVGDGWRDAACGSAPPGRNDGSAPHKADEVMRAAALAAAGVRGERLPRCFAAARPTPGSFWSLRSHCSFPPFAFHCLRPGFGVIAACPLRMCPHLLRVIHAAISNANLERAGPVVDFSSGVSR